MLSFLFFFKQERLDNLRNDFNDIIELSILIDDYLIAAKSHFDLLWNFFQPLFYFFSGISSTIPKAFPKNIDHRFSGMEKNDEYIVPKNFLDP